MGGWWFLRAGMGLLRCLRGDWLVGVHFFLDVWGFSCARGRLKGFGFVCVDMLLLLLTGYRVLGE